MPEYNALKHVCQALYKHALTLFTEREISMKISRVILSVVCVLLSDRIAEAENKTTPTFTKSSISFRISESISLSDERFEQLVTLLEKYKGVTDQVSFFMSPIHSPLPLETIRERYCILQSRMKRLRDLGYEAGLNNLCTMGHHAENLSYSVGPEFVRVMDLRGEVSQGCLCPNQENFRDYVRELYRIQVAMEPDYIWIDDDVRLAGHMPISETCFCDTCLRLFSEAAGTEYTRETLRARWGDQNVREQWLKHNDETISRLFLLIQQTVHELRPGLPLGFMTGERYYESYNFGRWADILAGPENVEVLWRPGGGFYRDEPISGMLEKSRQIGRQVSLLPPEVRRIQSEIENFPYQRLMKSARITALEAATHIAAGCTGAAFNVLTMHEEPLDEFEPLLAELHRWRPFYDLLVKYSGRETLTGVFPVWKSNAWIYRTGAENYPEIDALGIPWTPSAEGKRGVTILNSVSVRQLSDEEIRTILSEGVYMDADTLEILNSRGFGELTGMEKLETSLIDSIERFTEHPLNGTTAGQTRDCRQSFWRSPAHLFRKTNPNVQTLSERNDHFFQKTGDCMSGVFENRLGGRIYVGGYHPYDFLWSKSKAEQTREIMRWLSRDRLPAYVDSYHKANLWVRELPGGGLALILLNNSYDAAENVALRIKTPLDKIAVFNRTCKPRDVTAVERNGEYRRFVLSEVLEPWDMCLVVVKP